MTTVIFLDGAGTLFQVREPVAATYCRVARGLGFEAAGAAEFQTRTARKFRNSFRRHEPMVFPLGASNLQELERAWWRRVVEETFEGSGFTRTEQFFHEMYAFYGTRMAWDLEPGCREALLTLRERGHRLGVISNFDSRLHGLLGELEISHFFEVVVTSSQVGAAKPDRRIFQVAAERMKVEPASCLHIGDDWEDDFEGARTAGLRAVLYDPGGRSSGRTAARVRRLPEVSRFLV